MKYSHFLHIANLLNKKLSIIPLLFGSLGLERLLKIDLNADDIDILIPEVYLNTNWHKIIGLMNDEGYYLCNEEEHEFKKSDVKIAFASIESLESFACIDINSIPFITDNGITYLLLTLDDYLKVYKASSKDGYRKNVKNKQDEYKINLIEKALKN